MSKTSTSKSSKKKAIRLLPKEFVYHKRNNILMFILFKVRDTGHIDTLTYDPYGISIKGVISPEMEDNNLDNKRVRKLLTKALAEGWAVPKGTFDKQVKRLGDVIKEVKEELNIPDTTNN